MHKRLERRRGLSPTRESRTRQLLVGSIFNRTQKWLYPSTATYAKSASRYWENDSQTPHGCSDLALQLVHGEVGRNLNVILGGGYREFLSNTKIDVHGRTGRRTDNRDLIKEWMISQRRPYFVHDRVSHAMTPREEIPPQLLLLSSPLSTPSTCDISISFWACSARVTCNIICLTTRELSRRWWKWRWKRCKCSRRTRTAMSC